MSHAGTPQIPEVTDEAGESPKWLPLLGAGLFALAVVFLFWVHSSDESSSEAAPAAEAAP